MLCIQEQPTEGVRPNPGKMARSDPRPSVRVTRGAGSGQHLASVLQEGRENANIDAGLGFIWRISANRGGSPQREAQMLVRLSIIGAVAAILMIPHHAVRPRPRRCR